MHRDEILAIALLIDLQHRSPLSHLRYPGINIRRNGDPQRYFHGILFSRAATCTIFNASNEGFTLVQTFGTIKFEQFFDTDNLEVAAGVRFLILSFMDNDGFHVIGTMIRGEPFCSGYKT